MRYLLIVLLSGCATVTGDDVAYMERGASVECGHVQGCVIMPAGIALALANGFQSCRRVNI